MKRIALFIEPNHGFTRRMMRGISAYAEQHAEWVMHFGPPTYGGFRKLCRWRPDGVLAHLSKVPGEVLWRLGCPIVSLGVATTKHMRVTSVSWDRRAAGETAGRYFLERGFRSVAFLGGVRMELSRARVCGLRAYCEARGVPVAVYWAGRGRDRFWRWPELGNQGVAGWLGRLSKPVGVMCGNDTLGRDLLETAAQAGFAVPHDIAVLGSSNDDLICELSRPRLSSIEAPHEKMGFHGAQLLDAMIDQPDLNPAPVVMAGFRVVTRTSTDMVAAVDPLIKRALAHIAGAVSDPRLDIPAVAVAVGVSRRTLERRFMGALGRTVLAEIKRIRLDRVAQTLAGTQQSVKRIAYECGYASPSRLDVDFRQSMGMTPLAYREHHATSRMS